MKNELINRVFIIISIHALRGEGDYKRKDIQNIRQKFQSTPSVGRATLFIVIHIIRA